MYGVTLTDQPSQVPYLPDGGYNPREGNDLYLVYNEDFNTSRYQEIPTLPIYNSRTFLIKYTYTFSLGK